VGDRAGEATTLNNIGKAYDSMGERQKALDCYSQGLPLWRAVGDRAGEATTLNNIGLVYDALGEKQKALDYLNQGLSLDHAVGDRAGEARALNNIGGVYSDLGEKQKALDYYSQALPLLRAVGNRAGEATTLSNIGGVYDALGEKQKALDYYSQALPLRRAVGDRAGEVATLGNIRQGVDPQLLERERTLQQQVDAKSALRTQLLGGKHTEEQARAANKEIDELLSQYQDVEAKIRAVSPRYAVLTQPQPLSAKEVQQQVLDSDTLLLEYALGEEHTYLWAVTPNSLATYTLPKRQEIESLAKQAYDLLREESGPQYWALALKLSQMILGPASGELRGKRLLIVADGALQYLPFGALPVPRPRSADPGLGSAALQDVPAVTAGASAEPSRPLLMEHEIVYLPSASTLAVLRRDSEGRKPAAKLLALMADPVFSAEDDRVRARTIASSGGAGAVASSRASEGQGQDIAAEIRQSQLTRSAQESELTREGGIPRLLFTRQEDDGIASLVRSDLRLVDLDFAASKPAATSGTLSQYRMVHLATHGLLDSEHPELSGVVLSMVDEKGAAVDGFLRLEDIYNLNLPADLVVLSACQTGLGKEMRGEGLIGLTRGFMYAGAPRVVVSLWSVDDPATAELMKRFYRAILVDKLRPAAALRSAQMELRNDPQWSPPYYWAGFVLQGEWK
jgi:CHAT domain-containing protein/Tfp pilus assembly protein PilF